MPQPSLLGSEQLSSIQVDLNGMSLSQLENKIKTREDALLLTALQAGTGLSMLQEESQHLADRKGVGKGRALFPSSCPN